MGLLEMTHNFAVSDGVLFLSAAGLSPTLFFHLTRRDIIEE